MRSIPSVLQAKLDSGVTTLCRCWLITRNDGVVQGFTDHDEDVVVGSVTCHAGTGLTSFQMADFSQNGMNPQNYSFGDTSGYAAGFQMGYDYQLANNVVLGVGGEFSWSNTHKDMVITGIQGGEVDANWFAGVHGRIGYAIGDILIFGKAGYAVADMDGKYKRARRIAGELVWSEASDSSRFSGWTAGGGIEYALSDKVTVTGEYSFANLTHGSFETPELNGVAYRWKGKPRIDQIKLGVNYRF